MKRELMNDELEDFLRRSSDRLQMRPSDKVWKAISDNQNKRRRRIAWFTGSFLVVTSLAGYFFTQNSERFIKPLASAPAGNASSRETSTVPAASPFIPPGENSSLQSSSGEPATVSTRSQSQKPTNPLKIAYRRTAIRFPQPSVADVPATLAIAQPLPASFATTMVDSDPEAEAVSAPPADLRGPVTDEQTIESIVNLYQRRLKGSKLSVQFFATPTVSYRKLTENKPYYNSVPQSGLTPNYAALYDINDAVTHKPNIGLELGVAAKYSVASNVRLQAGLQFNMSRYDIKAFSNYYNEPATIAYSNGGSGMRPTAYSNFSGSKSDWLHNLYFQVSAPVGVEVKFGQSRKTQFGIAGTLQPTYMIGDRVYLISTDYKKYVEVPWLMRRWNVNTALETFVAYSTKKMDWQIGPQVRYQLLSSFVGKYPVKEHLFDFGLKVGITLKKKPTDSNQ